MATYEPTTEYAALKVAEDAFMADDMNLDKLHALDAAEAVFFGALKVARAEWMALPDGPAKFSAETNAEDTEGCDTDELKWLRVALSTHQLYEA